MGVQAEALAESPGHGAKILDHGRDQVPWSRPPVAADQFAFDAAHQSPITQLAIRTRARRVADRNAVVHQRTEVDGLDRRDSGDAHALRGRGGA